MPFSRDQFLAVFEAYNRAVWPAQFGLGLVALVALILALRARPLAQRGALGCLAVLWSWMGVVYHWGFFSAINPAAWIFGAAFVVQAGLFALAAFLPVRPPGRALTWSLALGASLLVYAMIVYPLIGQLSDHAYPRSPTFGLPCPTTIFTFGTLLVMASPPRRWLLVVPVAWAAVGSTAPFGFGIWEDLGLLVAALTGLIGVSVRVRARNGSAESVTSSNQIG